MKNYVNSEMKIDVFFPLKGVVSAIREIPHLGVMVVAPNGEISFCNDNLSRWLHLDNNDVPNLQEVQSSLYKQCTKLNSIEAETQGFELFSFTMNRTGLTESIDCQALILPAQDPLQLKSDCHFLIFCWFEGTHRVDYLHLHKDKMSRNLIQNAPIGILNLNSDWECNFANTEVSNLTEFTNEEILGRGWTRLFEHNGNRLHNLIRDTLNGGCAHSEITLNLPEDDKVVQLEIKGKLNEQGNLEHAVCALVDITDRVKRQEEIHKLANFDSITGLHNRVSMKICLENYIDLATRLKQKLHVLFIDLDGFKSINDIYGHATGDLILVQAAKRLLRQVRQSDMVARFGGDEFIVFMPGEVPDDVVDAIADKINAALRHTYHVNQLNLSLSASIGIASFSGDEQSEHIASEVLADKLLKEADMAMYAAKNAGKNQFHRYNAKHSEQITTSYTISLQLPSAILNNDIKFFFQPIVETATSELVGIEALLRWEHSTLGKVNPESVIAIAEANGLIADLQHHMINSTKLAFAMLLERPDIRSENLRLSINICPFQLFSAKYTKEIAESFRSTSFGCQRVTLELTESTLIEDRPEVAENLLYLKQQGFAIALDDFGTGYSALSYLSRFPIDIVKLDKTFIHSLTANKKQHALVSGCVNLIRSLDKKVVAEGVETASEHAALLDMGCDLTQGYHYGRPMEFEALYDWIRTH